MSSIGGSKGTSSNTSSSNANQTSTTTPNLPSYLSGGESSYYGDVNNLMNYFGSGANGSFGQQFVAPASTDQTAAYTNAGQLGGYQPTLNSAISTASTAAAAPANTYNATTYNSQSLLDGLQNYMNPQINDVINTTDNLYNKQIGASNAQLENQGAQSGAFGGSRFGLAQGEQNADNSMNEANVNANLYNQAYNQAETASNQDADRRQSAAAGNASALNTASQYNTGAQETADSRALSGAGLLGTLANDQNTNQTQDVASQLAAGDDQRGVAQDQAQSYITMLQQFQGLLGLNPAATIGSTSNGTVNTNSQSQGTTTSIGGKFGS